MAGYLWNNSWLFNPRLGSCPDLLLRTILASANSNEAGKVAFNAYYFGPASTGSISGTAVIQFGEYGNGGTSGTSATLSHLWNNSWTLNPRLGSCPDWLVRQIFASSNTNEAGPPAYKLYYFGPNPSHGTLVCTAANTTLLAAGTVMNSGVTGTLTKTAASATISSAAKTLVHGALSTTAANAALSASGKTQDHGVLSKITAAATISAAGKVLDHGALTTTTANAALSASGKVIVHGQLSQTLVAAQIAASGGPPLEITGLTYDMPIITAVSTELAVISSALVEMSVISDVPTAMPVIQSVMTELDPVTAINSSAELVGA